MRELVALIEIRRCRGAAKTSVVPAPGVSNNGLTPTLLFHLASPDRKSELTSANLPTMQRKNE